MGLLGSFLNAFVDSLGDSGDYSDGILCPVCGSKAKWVDTDEKSVWVCSSCGYEIHGDQVGPDETGTYHSFGIDWYCDNCGAHLNNQVGFDPYGKRWKCTECGFRNNITKNNVI